MKNGKENVPTGKRGEKMKDRLKERGNEDWKEGKKEGRKSKIQEKQNGIKK
jgi:hypothetical protein